MTIKERLLFTSLAILWQKPHKRKQAKMKNVAMIFNALNISSEDLQQ